MTMKQLEVVIPLSSDLPEDRARALFTVLSRLPALQADKVFVAECSPTGTFRTDLPDTVAHIRMQEPWNKPAAVNEAILNHCAAEWIMVLDADILIDFNRVREQLEAVPGNTRAIRPFSQIYRIDHATTDLLHRGPASFQVNRSWTTVSVMCGGVFLIRRTVYLGLRGMDERFDFYMEDVDLNTRLTKSGPVAVFSGISGYHLHHLPVKRDKAKYMALYRTRRSIPLANQVTDTRSRIPIEMATTPPPAPDYAAIRAKTAKEQAAKQQELRRLQTEKKLKAGIPPCTTVPQAPSARKIIIGTVLPDGDEYTAEHVWWLYRQIGMHMKTPWKFVCVAADPDTVPGGVKPKVPGKVTSAWSPLSLFDPVILTDADTLLYIPLSTAVSHDLPIAFPQTPGIWMDMDSGDCRVMLIHGNQSRIHSDYIGQIGKHKAEFANCMDYLQWTPNLAGKIQPLSEHLTTAPAGTDDESTQLVLWDTCRPWNASRSGSIPLKATSVEVRTLWTVACWFGSDGQRLEAAREGARRMCSGGMAPKPSMLLVEATVDGTTQIPEWTEDRLMVIVGDKHRDIWQKERMMNLGMQHILATQSDVEGFYLPDVDVYPDTGHEDLAVKTLACLRERMIVQPWKTVYESDRKTTYTSTAYMMTKGARRTGTGPGFAVAVSADFVRGGGRFLDECVSGGGDSATMEAWAAPGSLDSIVSWISDMDKAIKGYAGPRPGYGFVPCNIVHHYHGDRFGPADNRKYVLRSYLWNWCGGSLSVIEPDPVNQLWKWKDTPKARATRSVWTRLAEFAGESELQRAWKEVCAAEGV